MHWGNPTNPLKKGIPLRKLDAGRGNWFYGRRFLEVGAAKAWGMSPSQFDSLQESDKAEMMEYIAEKSKMEAYEYKRSQKRARGWN